MIPLLTRKFIINVEYDLLLQAIINISDNISLLINGVLSHNLCNARL